MKCKNCGAELNNGDLFCMNCGNVVDYSDNKKKRVVIISVIAVAVVLIIAAVVVVGLLLNKNKTDNEPAVSVVVSHQESSSESKTVSSSEQTTFSIAGETETTTTQTNNDVYYYVSTETPDDAGIVVRKEGTYYSDKITVLAEGTRVYISPQAIRQGEYIQISFDLNGKRTDGWALERYIHGTSAADADADQYTLTTEFEQRRVNLYVSNITETGISDFDGRPTDADIMKFAINHSVLNYAPSVSALEYDDFTLNGKSYDVRISARYADSLSVRFFGMDINIADMNNDYAKGYLLYGNAAQVRSEGVAIVRDVHSNHSASEYKISFSIYKSDSSDESKYYAYTPAQAAADSSLKYVTDGYVIVQKYDSSYKIVEYKRTN
ncbi:MAG: zinc ribbon domain-containing protein [Clostridia bacterium]|nr:zinc ribbon domain-containing protein [Clostridia bacterium]